MAKNPRSLVSQNFQKFSNISTYWSPSQKSDKNYPTEDNKKSPGLVLHLIAALKIMKKNRYDHVQSVQHRQLDTWPRLPSL